MTVFNRATFIISQAIRKTAAAVKLPTTADEILKLHPVGEPAKPAIPGPAKTAADLYGNETGPITPDELQRALYHKVMAPKPVDKPYTGPTSETAMWNQHTQGLQPAPTLKPETAHDQLQTRIQRQHDGKAMEGDIRGRTHDLMQHAANLRGNPAQYGGAAGPADPTMMDRAGMVAGEYVKNLKNLDPLTVGGTALAAGGTVALLHHLMSGKKTRKTAANILSTATRRPPPIRDAEFTVQPNPTLPAPKASGRLNYPKSGVIDSIINNPGKVGAGLAGTAAIGAAGAGGYALAHKTPAPVAPAPAPAGEQKVPAAGNAPAEKVLVQQLEDGAGKAWDATKAAGKEYGDNLMKGDGKTWGITGAAVGGAALLHHLLTKRSRRDEE